MCAAGTIDGYIGMADVDVKAPRRVLMTAGTVLDDGEDVTSERVAGALGPWYVVRYHGVWQAFPDALPGMPGGEEWLAGVNAERPEGERHLAVHEGHVTHVMDARHRGARRSPATRWRRPAGSGPPTRSTSAPSTSPRQGADDLMFTPAGDFAREMRAVGGSGAGLTQNSTSSSSSSSGSRSAAADPLAHRGQGHDRVAVRARCVRRARRRRCGTACTPARTSRRRWWAVHRTGTARRTRRGTRCQIATMRSTSACAPAHTLKSRCFAFRFIGSAERRFTNPEWISPHTARQWARATRSDGSSPESGRTSLRYSPIAIVSHTVTPSCTSLRDEERRRQQQQLRARVGIVVVEHVLVELETGHLAQQPTAQRPRAVVPAVDGQRRVSHR